MASRSATLRGAMSIPGGARPTPAPQGGGMNFSGGRALNAPSIGQPSPLAAQLANEGSGYTRMYGGFLPRPTGDFTAGAFGPISPILPVPVDEPPEGAVRPEARRFEYQVGWNLPVGQPGQEGLRLTSFETMRRLADVYSVARACIEYRKNQVKGIDWDIIPTPEATKAYQQSPSLMADFGKRRAKALKFFKKPDQDYMTFGTWISVVVEELLVYDALSLLMRPVRGKGRGKGVLGSDFASFMTVHGPTIRPLLDLHGGTPRPPAPAYQQYLYGVPRSDYLTMITQDDIDDAGLAGSEVGSFRGDQLLYLPSVPRAWTPYGFSAIERALIPIMTGLQKQGFQYDWFAECHDDQTEILTKAGWKLFDKLSDDDEVATRSADGEFQWQKPEKRQKYWHDADDEPMVRFENRTVDILVTQNHRMLVQRPDEYVARHPGVDGGWHFRFAGEFLGEPKKYEVPLVSTWRGSAPEEFILEKDGPRHREFRAPMLAFCEFLGLYLAEGWTNSRNCIIISQAAHSRHMDDIKRILDAVGLKWRYFPESRKFMMADARLTRWLNAECGHRAWNKHVPAWFKGLTPECLEKIWAGLIMGDGVTRENGVRCLTTTSSRLADDSQEILQKLSVNSRMVKRNHDVPSSHTPNYLNGRLMNYGRQQYLVGERQRDRGRLPIAKAEAYTGYVYCVTVPNGVVLTRRNGKQAWTGNSTVPSAYVIPGDTAMTPNQLRELQDALNAIAGDPAWKQKIIVLPPGSHVEPQRPGTPADELDQLLFTETCMAFGLSPMEIGVTPARSSSMGAQNQMAKMSQKTSEDAGLTPILKFFQDIFNLILQQVCNQEDMLFTFEGLQEEEDVESLTGVLVQQVQNGLRTVDEARQELNMQPYGLEETTEPLFVTPNGPVPLSTAIKNAESAAAQQEAQAQQTQAGVIQTHANVAQSLAGMAATQAGTEATQQNTEVARSRLQMQQEQHEVSMNEPGAGQMQERSQDHQAGMATQAQLHQAGMATQAQEHQSAMAQQAQRAQAQQATAKDGKPTPGHAAARAGNREAANTKKSFDPVLVKRQAAEYGALVRHLNKGRPVSTWEAKFVSEAVLADVAKGMAHGLAPSDAVSAAKARAEVQLAPSEYEWVTHQVGDRLVTTHNGAVKVADAGPKAGEFDFVAKVGKKGYIHGWIYVGTSYDDATDEDKLKDTVVQHPELGRGHITGTTMIGVDDKGRHEDDPKFDMAHSSGMPAITARFGDGEERTFEVRAPSGDQYAFMNDPLGLDEDPVVTAANGNTGLYHRGSEPQLKGGAVRLTSALMDYISPEGNARINHGLRADTNEVFRYQKTMEYMDRQLLKHTLKKDTQLYRGIAMTPDLEKKMTPGTTFTDLAYTSTSTSPDWAHNFAKARVEGHLGTGSKVPALGGTPVVMRIHVPAGTHMIPGQPNLGEYILPHGTTFKVNSVSDGLMDVSVVNDPFNH